MNYRVDRRNLLLEHDHVDPVKEVSHGHGYEMQDLAAERRAKVAISVPVREVAVPAQAEAALGLLVDKVRRRRSASIVHSPRCCQLSNANDFTR